MAKPYSEWVCARCKKGTDEVTVNERYSFGCYAGRYCDECWPKSGFRDAVDPDAKFDPMDAGESMDPEPTCFGEEDW